MPPKVEATYTNNPTPIAIGRISFDIKNINENADNLDKEGIYFKFNNDQGKINTHYNMLLIGPTDTPYEGGFYFFRGQFPDQYPFFPMKMTTETQGGNVRKHPNLYTTGKCCFSFLGTWSGPPWTACQNAQTVACSIRSVLTDNPLENEPGYENKKTHVHLLYAKIITYFNIEYAVVNILESISVYSRFEQEIVKNFIKYYPSYMKNIELFSNLEFEIIASPVYHFSIPIKYHLMKNKLEYFYNKYTNSEITNNLPFSIDRKLSIDTNFSTSTSISSTSNETTDNKPITHEIQVNNIDEVLESKEKSKTSSRKAPNEPPKNYEVGYQMKSTNDNNIYQVVDIKYKDGRVVKKWIKATKINH